MNPVNRELTVNQDTTQMAPVAKKRIKERVSFCSEFFKSGSTWAIYKNKNAIGMTYPNGSVKLIWTNHRISAQSIRKPLT